MQQLDDEALGWFSRKLPWGSLGMLCRASISSPNLDIALRRWCRHHDLLTDDVRLTLQVHDGVAECAIEERIELGAMREFCLMTILRNIHGYACWLIDSRIALRDATFPFARLAITRCISSCFRESCGSGSPARDSRSMRSTCRCRCDATRRRCAPCCSERCCSRCCNIAATGCSCERVRALLRAQPAALSNADAVARALHMSSPNLASPPAR